MGGVTVNLFTSSVADELAEAMKRFQATVVVAQDQEQVDKLLETRSRLGFVKSVVYVDPTGMRTYRNDPWLTSFRELLERGDELEREKPQLFPSELWRGRPDDVAVMIQTSGTTGLPKLAMLTHRNFTAMARKWLVEAPVGIGSNWLSITPPAWIVDQVWGAGITLTGGLTMNFPETAETIETDFREIGPEIIVSSSRFWEDLASKIRVKMADSGYGEAQAVRSGRADRSEGRGPGGEERTPFAGASHDETAPPRRWSFGLSWTAWAVWA